MQHSLVRAVLGLSVVGALACSGKPGGGFGASDAGPAGPEGGVFTPGDGGGFTGPTEVYGHSDDKLYRLDAVSKAVREVGTFFPCTHIADIAIDADSTLYASTGTELYIVSTTSARCTRVAAGTFPNSLSFVPRGTLDANAEALVGYQGADYVRIDRQTWQVTKIGSIGGGLVSSGDLVSVKDGGTYLTVKGPSCADCLVEIDPKTGALVRNWGAIGKDDVFGIAFWGGAVYGFARSGDLFQLTFDQDKLVRADIDIPSRPPGLSFLGAGSTTSAPLLPPK
jgi:hypothetical protein